ncbi:MULTISPECIES: HigA family addiction module antitoxin [unclassified Pseudomonas]|uniref:HigA family addiction module antitoxin n=1 Tax=unclassified Pseudomonas TaxID=196821 RepID=UPI000A1E945C|nr:MULTISPECIES: HigA family addiction module antitoxin [unclassified Pseudomonas]
MPQFDPPYPGESLREDVMPEFAMTTAQLAKMLDYPQDQLAAVLSGHAPISLELAQKLEAAGLGAARQYLAEQAAHDKWKAR